ncbi:MAG: hypothetical protein RMM29_09640 [Planctomycetota bacterium]|nr:hypothetical protein [Planctomycetota bacterium]MCX8040414.1 hypothetical protein [Planctomycetota bacterium]MDW8373891.1 hypothetical protein [Planctomycetota bacterium]
MGADLMETHLLAWQARVLLWTGLACIALGLWAGVEPVDIAWRSALAAMLAMAAAGWLLRRVVRAIGEQAAQELAARETKIGDEPSPALASASGERA